MKQITIFLFILCAASASLNFYQYRKALNTDPLTAYSNKYVVDLPEQLNGSDSLTRWNPDEDENWFEDDED